jgi:hypothetical protein
VAIAIAIPPTKMMPALFQKLIFAITGARGVVGERQDAAGGVVLAAAQALPQVVLLLE